MGRLPSAKGLRSGPIWGSGSRTNSGWTSSAAAATGCRRCSPARCGFQTPSPSSSSSRSSARARGSLQSQTRGRRPRRGPPPRERPPSPSKPNSVAVATASRLEAAAATAVWGPSRRGERGDGTGLGRLSIATGGCAAAARRPGTGNGADAKRRRGRADANQQRSGSRLHCAGANPGKADLGSPLTGSAASAAGGPPAQPAAPERCHAERQGRREEGGKASQRPDVGAAGGTGPLVANRHLVAVAGGVEEAEGKGAHQRPVALAEPIGCDQRHHLAELAGGAALSVLALQHPTQPPLADAKPPCRLGAGQPLEVAKGDGAPLQGVEAKRDPLKDLPQLPPAFKRPLLVPVALRATAVKLLLDDHNLAASAQLFARAPLRHHNQPPDWIRNPFAGKQAVVEAVPGLGVASFKVESIQLPGKPTEPSADGSYHLRLQPPIASGKEPFGAEAKKRGAAHANPGSDKRSENGQSLQLPLRQRPWRETGGHQLRRGGRLDGGDGAQRTAGNPFAGGGEPGDLGKGGPGGQGGRRPPDRRSPRRSAAGLGAPAARPSAGNQGVWAGADGPLPRPGGGVAAPPVPLRRAQRGGACRAPGEAAGAVPRPADRRRLLPAVSPAYRRRAGAGDRGDQRKRRRSRLGWDRPAKAGALDGGPSPAPDGAAALRRWRGL